MLRYVRPLITFLKTGTQKSHCAASASGHAAFFLDAPKQLSVRAQSSKPEDDLATFNQVNNPWPQQIQGSLGTAFLKLVLVLGLFYVGGGFAADCWALLAGA